MYHTISFSTHQITIFPIGDLHIGALASEPNKFLNFMKSLDENEYVVIVGDLIDANTKDSVSDVNDIKFNIDESIGIVQSAFAEHTSKILGVVSGNHEARITRRTGVDVLKLLCANYRIPYDESILVLDIMLPHRYKEKRQKHFVLALGHGYSAARTVGGKVLANSRIMDVIADADVYITGHTHLPSVIFDSSIFADRNSRKLKKRTMAVVTVPAWLGYSAYAQRKFYAPPSFPMLKITLDASKAMEGIEISFAWKPIEDFEGI